MAGEKSIFLFCIPKEIKGKSIEEIARLYTQMTIKDYDSFVTFDQTYESYKEQSDSEDFVFKKEGIKIYRTLFLDQPMTRAGTTFGSVKSSSHLFNPECNIEGLLLPDMDVVEFEKRGEGQATEIKQFYEKNGWKVGIYVGEIIPTIQKAKRGRFKKAPTIIDPLKLIEIAKEKFGYNSKKLCWT